ncbi:hypothetical protein PM082_015008 [Marasmius tenuissimus]|nr:hypothetical protein PM082_015008 [Marasmius tenuissimus]
MPTFDLYFAISSPLLCYLPFAASPLLFPSFEMSLNESPAIPIVTLTPVATNPDFDVEDPNASAHVREHAIKILRAQFGQHLSFDGFLSSLTSVIDTLQASLRTRNGRLQELERTHEIATTTLRHSLARNTVLSRLQEYYKKEAGALKAQVGSLQEMLQRLQTELVGVREELASARSEFERVDGDRAEMEKVLTTTKKRLVFCAREGFKYRRGNAIHAFPELQSKHRRMHWELSIMLSRLNGISGIPDVSGLSAQSQYDEVVGCVQRVVKIIEEVVTFVDRVEITSLEITGPMDENTIEREIAKAAEGSRPRYIVDVLGLLKRFTSPRTDRRPFRVNVAPVKSLLARPSSSASTSATNGSAEWSQVSPSDD